MLTWNLFHGRDAPPDSDLLTWRSRLLRFTERGESHAQVNRDLFEAFAAVIAGADWDIALLQECPPRWAEGLATATDAEPHLAPTSRNLPGLGRLQGTVAAFNPDLIASWEGGSNLTLVRDRAAGSPAITGRTQVRIARRPEQRVIALSRLAGGLCVANLHASKARPAAERELLDAAAVAVEWAAGLPPALRRGPEPATRSERSGLRGARAGPRARPADRRLGDRPSARHRRGDRGGATPVVARAPRGARPDGRNGAGPARAAVGP